MSQSFFLRCAASLALLAILPSSDAMAQQNNGGLSVTTTRKMAFEVRESDHTILPDGRYIYNRTEQMPSYKSDLFTTLAANLRYPEQARKRKIEGRSVIRFIVNPDGTISDAEVSRSSGDKLLDEEALRAVQLLDQWVPGQKNGLAVPVYMQLPVVYKLD